VNSRSPELVLLLSSAALPKRFQYLQYIVSRISFYYNITIIFKTGSHTIWRYYVWNLLLEVTTKCTSKGKLKNVAVAM